MESKPLTGTSTINARLMHAATKSIAIPMFPRIRETLIATLSGAVMKWQCIISTSHANAA